MTDFVFVLEDTRAMVKSRQIRNIEFEGAEQSKYNTNLACAALMHLHNADLSMQSYQVQIQIIFHVNT